MRAVATRPVAGPIDEPLRRNPVLVWIDSREAIMTRWAGGVAHVERLRSDVPAHHRATGNVRHRPDVRHGGGGVPQTAGEPRRLEHLERFLAAVMERIPAGQDVLLLGPGTVHEHLAREIRDRDAEHRNTRDVRCDAAPPMTRAQLVARLRHAMGDEPRRRTVGAYRWTKGPRLARSGRPGALPVRVAAAHRRCPRGPAVED